MNAESKINIHHSSLMGLKTELLRKQAEVQVAKVKQEHFVSFNMTKTKDKTTKKKKKNLEVNSKLNQTDNIEYIKALQKSKLILQAKSRLYEKLSNSRTNMNPNCLVDFKLKSNDSKYINKKYFNLNKDCDSNCDWVEYIDFFGRTRKCLKKDLPEMQEKDEFIKEKIYHDKNEKQLLYIENTYSKIEPEIELMRKKWEEQTTKLMNKVNIHYEDVLFDEARTHGVGYYAFSQDEEKRIKQQQNLLKLRKETEQKQTENKNISVIKDELQQNRLRVARLRQKIQAGLLTEANKNDVNITNLKTLSKLEISLEQDKMIGNKKVNHSEESNKFNRCEQNNKIIINEKNKQEIVSKKLIDMEKKIQVYEVLLGKRKNVNLMSQEEWVHKKRKERIDEFKPIYENLKKDNLETRHKYSIESITLSHDNFIKPILNTDTSSIIESVPLLPNKSSNVSKITQEIVSQSTRDTAIPANIVCQIEAGLKFLREQFENKHT